MRFRLSTLLYWLVIGSILARLLLSSWLLDSWYPYSAEGGQPYYKIHPGSLLAFLAVAILAFVKGVPTLLRDLWQTQRATVIYMASVVLVSAVSTLFHGVSGAAYLIDTFLAAGCYPILLGFIDAGQALRIATLVLAVVGVNSGLAIAEYAGGFHLLPQPYSYGFFRASALFGHPLTNGLLTATSMFAALAVPWGVQSKAGYMAMLLLSLFAFGARGALLVSAVAVVIAILAYPHVTKAGRRNRIVMLPLAVAGCRPCGNRHFGRALRHRVRATPSHPVWPPTTLPAPAGFDWKSSSSSARSELFYGCDAPTLGYLLGSAGVPIVENFWVAMLLRLGWPLLLILGFRKRTAADPFCSGSSFYLQLQLVVFVAMASTNNSLATKSCALAVLVLLLAALGRGQVSLKASAARELYERLALPLGYAPA